MIAYEIRGMALPFCQIGEPGDRGREIIARDAIGEGQFVGGRSLSILAGEHDGPVLGSTSEIFVGRRGVFFRASIRASRESDGMLPWLKAGTCRCSAMLHIERQENISDASGPLRRITKVRLEHHVALLANPAYPGTAAWIAGAAPPQLRAMAWDWDLAFRLHRCRQVAQEDRRAQRLAAISPPRSAPPPAVAFRARAWAAGGLRAGVLGSVFGVPSAHISALKKELGI